MKTLLKNEIIDILYLPFGLFTYFVTWRNSPVKQGMVREELRKLPQTYGVKLTKWFISMVSIKVDI